jgi:pyrroline-5-carboxylate reductase
MVSRQLAKRFSIVGAGKMAEAMCSGIVRVGLQPAAATHVFDTNRSRMTLYQERWPGIKAHASAAECVEGSDVVLLSVKPQHMPGVLDELSASVSPDALVVSIAAGCPISQFTSKLSSSSVVRSMPNTPAMVGEGMTVWTATAGCSAEQRETAQALLSSFGDQHYVEEEAYLDMATALVGSGPAFVYQFVEAMMDTGVHMGFPRDVAGKLVLKTFEGSVSYLRQSDKHVAALRNDITSPGGTTAAAVYTSEQGGFRTTVADGVWAAYRRSLELGGKDSNVGPGRSK